MGPVEATSAQIETLFLNHWIPDSLECRQEGPIWEVIDHMAEPILALAVIIDGKLDIVTPDDHRVLKPGNIVIGFRSRHESRPLFTVEYDENAHVTLGDHDGMFRYQEGLRGKEVSPESE